MRCAACRQRPAVVELLCDACVEALARPFRLVPERIRTIGIAPATTVLVDAFGRAHPLEATTLIGRQLEGAGLIVNEASVSRHHAHVSRDPTAGWLVRDLSSTNGTFVNDERAEGALAVKPGDRVRVGHVAFWFLDLPVLMGEPPAPRGPRTRNAPDTFTDGPRDDDDDAFEGGEASTRLGLPLIPIRLAQPSGGGGGVVELDGRRAQLTTTQYELLELLCRRSIEDGRAPDETRGFVGTAELVQRLSWETPQPTDEHVKQLIFRLRKLLERSGIGDLIESRHGYGYRLRVVPRAGG